MLQIASLVSFFNYFNLILISNPSLHPVCGKVAFSCNIRKREQASQKIERGRQLGLFYVTIFILHSVNCISNVNCHATTKTSV